MFGRSTSNFDRLLEKATSQLLLEPDWASIMSICDSIRQGDTNPKYAVAAIKKKFYHTNPHVALYALQVMESCVKNCGILVHEEISTKQFMEELRDLVKQSMDENIKTKVLELLQTWGMAFRSSPKYRIVTDTLNLMKAEGWKFPPVREAEAMFEADTAPEWSEGDVCHRCRVQFSTFTRQHHCRACGQVFCGKCSAKVCVLPKFGIEREVRVCDSCFDQHGPSASETPTSPVSGEKKEAVTSDLPAEYLASPLSKQPQEPTKPPAGGKTEAELKEEEELQLVLALSKSEAEEKEKEKKKATSEMLAGYGGLGNGVTNGSNGTVGGKGGPGEVKQDTELEKYLNRDYWEKRERQDTGPVSNAKSLVMGQGMNVDMVQAGMGVMQEQLQRSPTGQQRAEDDDLDEFTGSLRTQLEIFVNRMKSNSSRGRPIANDSSVQTLFMNVMTMHGKLVRHIQEQEDGRVMYEGMQDKLAQVKDARAALDALREEEMDRKRREQEELERQRQVQLAAKLDVMRKKKAEYLEYQRQVALQRMADQEREVAKIAEANKANYQQQQQGMYNMYLPYGYPQQGMLPPGQPGMPHPQGMPQPGSGMPPPVSAQSGMLPPGQGMPPPVSGQAGMPPHYPPQSGMLPPGQYPGYPYAQPNFPAPDQGGPPHTQSDPNMSQAPTTTSQQGTYNMSGMASTLPQQMPYMGQPPQSMGQPQQGYPQQQHGAPIQPQPIMMPGTAVTTQQQPIMMQGPAVTPQQQPPQPDAPSESLIVFD
eukprot:TRINITY_DN7532_c0_g1_i3.p1 TRINITY_DN7532_c0_g1~~TRINITY_DN7532_c0_g1_i3.p1  ORF type:complete len:761 (+),score=322.19 TRINITY_DN7532_c0_g1_i3:35-2317(+)